MNSSHSTPLLSVKLLGSFAVTVAEQSVDTFSTAKVRALLAYLAVEGNRPLDRSHLAGLLWPDVLEESARGNLRHALSNLRKVIGDQRADVPYLLATRRSVQLNPDGAISIDVVDFQALVATATTAPDAAEAAIALYRGPFLANDLVDDSPEFEQWVQFQRDRLHRQMAELLTQTAQNAFTSGDFSQAVTLAQQLVDHEPWREESHVQLMNALWHAGQGDAAMRQFELCRQLLAAELAVEPAAETVALYEAIRDDRTAFQTTPSIQAPSVQVHGIQVGENEQTDAPTEIAPPRHNLAPLLKPFFGRETELSEIAQRLAQPNCREVTITGPGGMGKSQLAQEYARRHLDAFADGVWFVPLAGVATGDAISTAIAEALGIALVAEQEPAVRVKNYLRSRSLLLVLDNYEHLRDHAALVTELLSGAPDLVILVTSRERLNLQMETVLSLYGLELPPLLPQSHRIDLETAQQSSAVRLFVDCAARADAGFTLTADNVRAVVNICHLTDGMPLGIELAAVWTRVLGCDEIYDNLKQNIDLLTASMPDLPARHRCIRALFTESWQQLSPTAQALFAKLSVFRGSFDRTAMQAVTGANLFALMELIDHSFVRKRSDRGSDRSSDRYDIHELMRQFGAEKLAEQTEDERDAKAAHAAYYMMLLDQLAPALFSREQVTVAAQVAQDLENVRAAWQWAVAERSLDKLALGMEGLCRYYQVRSLEFERAQMLGAAAAALAEMPIASALRMTLLAYRAASLFLLSRNAEARESAETILAAPTAAEPAALARANLVLGQLHEKSDPIVARSYFTAASKLYLTTEDAVGISETYIAMARFEYQQNNAAAIRNYGEQALVAAQEIDSPFHVGFALAVIGTAEMVLQEYDQARTYIGEALAISRQLQNQLFEADYLNNLAIVSLYAGDADDAYDLYQQSYTIHQRLGGNTSSAMINADNLARCAIKQGDLDRAIALFRETVAQAERIGDHNRRLRCRQGLAYVLMKQGDLHAARHALLPLLADEYLAGSRLLQGIFIDTIASLWLAEEAWVEAATVFAFIREHFEVQPGIYNRAETKLTELAASVDEVQLTRIAQRVVAMTVQDVFTQFCEASGR